jgi:23S rRNA pseudouridine1911/1915/1917 synthase
MKSDNKGVKPLRVSTFVVDREEELMTFLLAELKGKNRNNIKSLLTHKQVTVNGHMVSQYNHKLNVGDKVAIGGERVVEVNKSFRGFSIVFEDDHLIVIDKHSGILSIATEGERSFTAYNFLSKHVKFENPSNKIFIVHRLDRETSGLMVFAKSAEVQHLFQDNWKDTITERSYIAIAEGVIEEDQGVISSYLSEDANFRVHSSQNPQNGKLAVTHFKVLRRTEEYTMLQARLETGRKNQIRVHMQEIGHSLINDKKYGATTNPIDRLGLHSKVLAFIHPITKQPLRFETPIPRKFSRLFKEG